MSASCSCSWRLNEPITDLIDTRVEPRLDRVAQQEGRFVLPVDVVNPGARTIRDVQVRIEYQTGGGERRSMDVLVDVLGRSSAQVVYTYFKEDPRRLSIRAETISYRVD